MRILPLLTSLTAASLLAGSTIAASPPPVPATADRGAIRVTAAVPADAEPVAVAEGVLGDHAATLGVSDRTFVFDHVVTSPIGVHVHGREVRDGVAILGTSAAVHLLDGEVAKVQARTSDLPGGPTSNGVAEGVAVRVALRTLGLTSAEAVSAARWLVPDGGRLRDVWHVTVIDRQGAVAATVELDAADGRFVAFRENRRFGDYTANVFDPNPIVRLQDPTLRQPGVDVAGVDADLDDARINEARQPLKMLELEDAALAGGVFRGPWADVQGPAPMVAEEGSFDFTRMDPRFEAAMAYAHVDRLQRYIQDVLGLTGVNDEAQWIIAVPIAGFDNSFYQPGNDVIALGAGGVDDGEDAEVIVHEYGHAVHDAQVPGWGDHPEGGAMGEGFGDFLAAAWFARTSSKGFQDTCVADWDATSYSSDDPACLRRTDGTKVYPDDLEGAVHADGEMWSSFLWRVRARMVPDDVAATMSVEELAAARSDRVLRLLLTSHFLLSTTANFADAVEALQEAAIALDDRDALPIIEEEAERAGFDVFPVDLP